MDKKTEKTININLNCSSAHIRHIIKTSVVKCANCQAEWCYETWRIVRDEKKWSEMRSHFSVTQDQWNSLDWGFISDVRRDGAIL